MAIDIKGYPQPHQTSFNAETRARGNESVSTEKTHHQQNDTITLTEAALRLGQMDMDLPAQAEIDNRRVTEVKKLITEERYEVAPERISVKLQQIEMALQGI